MLAVPSLGALPRAQNVTPEYVLASKQPVVQMPKPPPYLVALSVLASERALPECPSTTDNVGFPVPSSYANTPPDNVVPAIAGTEQDFATLPTAQPSNVAI